MSTATFVAGKMQEYVSHLEFSLNFEFSPGEVKKSVKVKKGDIVQYDGVIAKYVKQPSGEEVSGKTTSLKSAIANNWLTLNVPGISVGPINVNLGKPSGGDGVAYKAPDYDPLKGGAFDDFLKKDADTVTAGSKYIKEQDQMVKATDFNAPKAKTASTKGKMEVAGDQVSVKEVSTTVSNSTSVGSQRTQKTVIVQADDGHADHVIVGKKKTAAVVEAPKAKNSFTVDSNTPSISEGATLSEVKNATASFDGAQDGRIVKKVGEKKMKMPDEPSEVEGIVLKKTSFSGKQSSGSTPVADLSGVKTQSEVDAIENEIVKRASSPAETPVVEKKNYVDLLPDDWSTLHWVKKEKFILEITDIEFLKFIMKVESVKAVHAACRKRMVELGKQQAASNS